MKILITGASGFLGQHVVREARQRGHDVLAQVRPLSKLANIDWANDPNVTFVRTDLRAKPLPDELFNDVDAVVHLAAAKSGDFYEQFGSTVMATENLLAAMVKTEVKRFIAISSFSVYDYLKIPVGSVLNENSPVYDDLSRCGDEYAQTKTLQERLVREKAEQHQLKLTVLRPGVIFGRDNLWTARLGFQLGSRYWARTGSHARLPLTYVDNCAQAIILAAEQGEASGATLNVVDDNVPTQHQYAAALRRRYPKPRPRIIPINWTFIRTLARMGWLVNRWCFGLRARVPAIFRPPALHARCKPLRFSNEQLKTTLGWKPRYTWQQGIERSEQEATACPPATVNHQGTHCDATSETISCTSHI